MSGVIVQIRALRNLDRSRQDLCNVIQEIILSTDLQLPRRSEKAMEEYQLPSEPRRPFMMAFNSNFDGFPDLQFLAA